MPAAWWGPLACTERLPLPLIPGVCLGWAAFSDMQAMDLLELNPIAHSLVGFIGVDGLTVEQAKRLSIGVELVRARNSKGRTLPYFLKQYCMGTVPVL